MRVRSSWFDKEYRNKGWFKGNSDNNTILPVLELNSELASSANDGTGNLPRDFWQALVSSQWREWVNAVKAEIESWDMFEAAEEVSFDDMERGATIIPLGELFGFGFRYRNEIPDISQLHPTSPNFSQTFPKSWLTFPKCCSTYPNFFQKSWDK